MEIYSIEKDGGQNEHNSQLQPSASVASSLSTHVLVPAQSKSNNASSSTTARNFNSTMRVKKFSPSKASKSCFYIFTCLTLVLFALCFIVMSIVTVRLLLNNYYAEMSHSAAAQQNGTNYTLNTNRKLEQDSVDAATAAAAASSLPTFNQYETNFLKFILSNLTTSINKSAGGGSNNRGGGGGFGSPGLGNSHVDDPYFERNLFSWLKNTFKMAFLGKLDGNGGDTKQPPASPSFPSKFGNFPSSDSLDNSIPNSVPFVKKVSTGGSGGLIFKVHIFHIP
jgi:hypothetical protein